MTASLRLAVLFAATVCMGVLATMLAPAFTNSLLAHGQTAPVSASAVGSDARVYARAVSAPPVTWTRAVATKALVRGDTLRVDDFILADTSYTGRLPYGVDTTTPQAGWLIRRAIAAGEWLRQPAVAPMPVVTAGQPVHVLWNDGLVQLTVDAVALNSATLGGAVSVRVGRTRRIDGVAIAPDSVRIR